MRVLVVEDEPNLLKIISRRLQEEGYGVDSSNNGEEGLYFATNVEYDCIILDLMLPILDGLTILKKLRLKNINIPVIILTAKDAIEDRVSGLDSGADDYLTKPFSFEELLARVRALLRRPLDSRENILSISDLTLDTTSHLVCRGSESLELTAREYSILEYFMRNKGRILTRSQIAEHVWNYDFDYGSNIIDVYIRYLRRKIQDDSHVKLIHTVRGSGYVLKVKE